MLNIIFHIFVNGNYISICSIRVKTIYFVLKYKIVYSYYFFGTSNLDIIIFSITQLPIYPYSAVKICYSRKNNKFCITTYCLLRFQHYINRMYDSTFNNYTSMFQCNEYNIIFKNELLSAILCF